MSRTIFLNAGIGDFLSFQDFIPADLSHIIFGTVQHREIEQILRAMPCYSFTSETPWLDWRQIRSFPWPGLMIERLGITKEEWQHVEDWSLASTFNRIDNGKIARVSPSYMEISLADVGHELPNMYAVINPASQSVPQRAFDLSDWEAALFFLSHHNLKGVVLGQSPQIAPQLLPIIDLTDQTTIPEAIEITKGASAFLGVDSCLSVVACRHLPAELLRIKSTNHQYRDWAGVYCFPHTHHPFVDERIKA